MQEQAVCPLETKYQFQKVKTLHYHLYTIWLFTRTDLKTIVIPSTIFGAVCTLSGPVMTTNPSPLLFDLIRRVPMAVFWTWINLLPFAIDNQRQRDSIMEDVENKPWRPLPAKRLTPEEAKSTMLVFYFIAFLSSVCIGGIWQCIILVGLGYWYNVLKGADRNCITRNFINACGYICFTTGALQVASGPSIALPRPIAYEWLLIIGLVIFTTIQSQDMYDQAGDRLRKRRTVPLVVGDLAARWIIAVLVGFWSWFCPAFWKLRIEGFAATAILGATIVWRILLKRAVRADRISFRIYNVWIISLFCLPLIEFKLRS